MNKQIVIGLIIAVIVVTGILFLLNKDEKEKQSSYLTPFPTNVVAKTPSKELKEYKDDSGFQFQHPVDVTLTKNSNLDDSTYADLLLISSQSNGSVTIKVTDTKFTSLEEWIKSASDTPKINNSTKLSEISALEIKVDNKLTTIALDKGILFSISMDSQKDIDYWLEVYKEIVSSFSFSAPQSTEETNATNSQNFEEDIVEEEEIIE